MSPPRHYWYVEWNAAQVVNGVVCPHQRRERARTYRSERTVARQVVSILKWQPSHTELIGVWVAAGFNDAGIKWSRLDDDDLKLLVDVLSEPDDYDDYPHQEEP